MERIKKLILACRKIIGYKLGEIFWDFGQNVLLALVMGVIVFIFGECVALSSYLMLFLQIVIGIVVYVLEAFVVKNESVHYIISSLKALKKKQ